MNSWYSHHAGTAETIPDSNLKITSIVTGTVGALVIAIIAIIGSFSIFFCICCLKRRKRYFNIFRKDMHYIQNYAQNLYNMLIMAPLFLDRHTLHAERCREISTATGIANKGCKLTTQPLPPVPDCYCESPVQGDDHEPYYLVPIKVRVKWFHRIHFPYS